MRLFNDSNYYLLASGGKSQDIRKYRVERFGKGKDTFYFKEDDDHFTVTTNVEISEQFFAWLCGFGEKVKLIGHEDTIADFKRYLDTIRGMY